MPLIAGCSLSKKIVVVNLLTPLDYERVEPGQSYVFKKKGAFYSDQAANEIFKARIDDLPGSAEASKVLDASLD